MNLNIVDRIPPIQSKKQMHIGTSLKLLILGLFIVQAPTPAKAQIGFTLPDYYVEGSYQIGAARMISEICPRIRLKPGLSEMYQLSLSGQLKEDNILPEDLTEDDRIFRLKLTTDKRFSDALIGLFEKYGLDPNAKGSVKEPEAYEKFCQMGDGEIQLESNIGNLLEPNPQ